MYSLVYFLLIKQCAGVAFNPHSFLFLKFDFLYSASRKLLCTDCYSGAKCSHEEITKEYYLIYILCMCIPL